MVRVDRDSKFELALIFVQFDAVLLQFLARLEPAKFAILRIFGENLDFGYFVKFEILVTLAKIKIMINP